MRFPGFFRPRSNFYRLPNDWFDIWAQVRRTSGRTRIVGLLKVVEYVIKWTWGRQNYERPVRITRRDFQYGRRWNGRRLDRGTGLSSRPPENAICLAEHLGLIESHRSGKDGGPCFLPHLRAEEEDSPGFLASGEEEWRGFPLPEANFFLVPKIWTDLTCTVTSDSLILAVEYFFRHTWGWRGGWDKPCWMTAEEVAGGRRYRSPGREEERYDRGIGYSVDRVRDALREGVRRGWLVWRRRGRDSVEYALHLRGMVVSAEGEFLGFEKRGEGMPAGDESTAPTDESTAPSDESTALTDESTAPSDESTAPYIQTLHQTLFQTPPPDTADASADGGGESGGGGGADDPLLRRLTSLDPPMSREDAGRLIATYGPGSVRAWLEALEGDPTVRSVAALLIHKLRTGQTPPGGGPGGPDPACPLCDGTGVVRIAAPEGDPDRGRTVPCPRCGAG
ncbi:MAG TPA: hypothetical protein G4O00_14510 [Thermoflexia bacterium]|nr:hypothetical protein [Thermoflexia bacterium]